MSRQNNFDLVRLVLGLVVVGQHLRDLTNVQSIATLFGSFSGLFAVQGFFVLSGFLIFQSFERSKGLKDYAEKRVRRVYPGYVASVLVFFVLCGLTSTFSTLDLLRNGHTWKYLIANLSFLNFLQDILPGVFYNQLFQSVNGALWTIKVEVMFYVLVPVMAALVRRFNSHWALVSLFVLSCAYRWYFTAVHPSEVMVRQLPGQLQYFCVGGWLYYNLAWFLKQGWWLFGVAVVGLALVQFGGEITVRPIVVGLLVMFVGFRAPYLGNWSRFGDFSYGVYIVHFPIIQLLVHAGLFARQPALGLGLTLLLVFMAAWLSWHLVEKRFLLQSSHYLAGKS